MSQLDAMKEAAKNSLARSLEAHQLKAETMIEAVVLYALQEWHKRFPKRKIHFMDAMGMVCISVDGIALDDLHMISARGSIEANERRQALVQPLETIRQWYINISSDHNICIADIKL